MNEIYNQLDQISASTFIAIAFIALAIVVIIIKSIEKYHEL